MTRMSLQIHRPKSASKKRPASRGSTMVRRSQPTTTEVYDTYWRFAYERQQVYFRRLERQPPPWTTDPIIRSHRFTNAYRASDRVSQFLIREVIYSDRFLSPKDLLLRILVFKFFNRIDTWELLEQSVGGIRWSTFSFAELDRVLTHAIDSGTRIYSPAYIMPACIALGGGRKHRGHLRLIEKMVSDGVAECLGEAKSMAEAFDILQGYPMMGDFLAFQYTIDLNYSGLTDFSEDQFVLPGPGARDGLRKVFSDPGEYSEADLIRWVADRQEEEFDRLGLQFRSLWGRRLHLIDCQNLFCEVDKYSRVYHPLVVGVSGRTRIKQRYEVGEATPTPWFPPKWGLNDRIKEPDPLIRLASQPDNLFAKPA